MRTHLQSFKAKMHTPTAHSAHQQRLGQHTNFLPTRHFFIVQFDLLVQSREETNELALCLHTLI